MVLPLQNTIDNCHTFSYVRNKNEERAEYNDDDIHLYINGDRFKRREIFEKKLYETYDGEKIPEPIYKKLIKLVFS